VYSIKQVESGLLKFIDKELLPNLTATGEQMLIRFCQSRMAQMMGVVTPDGQINVDVMKNVAYNFVPQEGLAFTFAGATIKFTRADIDTIYKMIKEG
jgi:hypothetical protein